MNAISPRHAAAGSQEPIALHFAAAAFAYPVSDGLLSFSYVASCLARAAIRQGRLDDHMSTAEFERLLTRLERTVGMTILDTECEAAETIRRIVRLCLERKAADVMTREAALCVNDQHGRVFPMRCIDWIIGEEIRRNG